MHFFFPISHKILRLFEALKQDIKEWESVFGWLETTPCPPIIHPSSTLRWSLAERTTGLPWLSSSIATSWRRRQYSRRCETSRGCSSSPLMPFLCRISFFSRMMRSLPARRADLPRVPDVKTPGFGAAVWAWIRRCYPWRVEVMFERWGFDTAASLLSILRGPAYTHISYAAMRGTSANPAPRGERHKRRYACAQKNNRRTDCS